MPIASTTIPEKFYTNSGNRDVLDLLEPRCKKVLDVGCGAGDNARLSRDLGVERQFYGITNSSLERESALQFMSQCWIEDIETSQLDCLLGLEFDAIIFSHVLEHVREPASIVEKFLPFLKSEGLVVVALPNVLAWPQRLSFLFGKFEYENDGVMDSSHVRFFTYHTADNCLPNGESGVRILDKLVNGSVPLWGLRRYVLPSTLSAWLDRKACAVFPNLFGTQIFIKAKKESS